MKTKIQLQRNKVGNYDILTMHILHPAKYGSGLTPIGSITWQGDRDNQWYGLRFVIDAELSNNEYILAMYKLACYIKERAIEKSPIEVMGIIGADQHTYDYGMYLALSDNGKYVYDIIKQDKTFTCVRIVAVNEIMAERMLNGMIQRQELNDGEYHVRQSHERLNKVGTDLTIA